MSAPATGAAQSSAPHRCNCFYHFWAELSIGRGPCSGSNWQGLDISEIAVQAQRIIDATRTRLAGSRILAAARDRLLDWSILFTELNLGDVAVPRRAANHKIWVYSAYGWLVFFFAPKGLRFQLQFAKVLLRRSAAMRRLRRGRLTAVLASSTAALAFLATTASARPLLKERFHNEGSIVVEQFCGIPDLTVEIAFVADVKVLAVQHGRDRFAYFLEHFVETGVMTNLANGKSVTQVSRVTNKDLRVTDNGDGTLTILSLGTGNDVLYGQDGSVLGRNPGQTRIEILVDHGGTPADPFDDEFIAVLGVVKGSTGRSDDFCALAATALR